MYNHVDKFQEYKVKKKLKAHRLEAKTDSFQIQKHGKLFKKKAKDTELGGRSKQPSKFLVIFRLSY